jgi:hypothetical protein
MFLDPADEAEIAKIVDTLKDCMVGRDNLLFSKRTRTHLLNFSPIS